MARTPPQRRLAAVVAAGLVPWTVVFVGRDLTLVFAFGLLNSNPVHLVPVTDFFVRYTLGVPQFIESWGVGAVLYLIGLASAASGVCWREDRRVTAAALTFAALSQFWVAAGFTRRVGTTAIPLGSLVLLAVVWWQYWPAVRATLGGGGRHSRD